MADPVSIALLIASLLGTGAGVYSQNRAQKKVESQRQGALAAEAQRQDMLGRESEAAVAATSEALSREGAEAAEKDLAAKYQAAITPQAPVSMADPTQYDVGGSAPTEVKSAVARSVYDALARNKDYARRAAALGGLRASAQSQNVALQRSGQVLNRIGGYQTASNNLLGGELLGANRSGQADRTRGDIYSSLGNIAGLYAMTRGTPAAKTPTPYQG